MKYTLTETEIIGTERTEGILFWNDQVTIANDTIAVKRGFSWNGCGVKFVWMDIRFGIPDGVGETTRRASMVHAALYRFKSQAAEQGVTRLMADQIFYDELKRNKFKLARLYYIGARMFGWMCGKWN